jgi:hypothetical protein
VTQPSAGDARLADITHHHRTAVLELLAGAGYPVHDGEVIGDREFPYLVLWGTPGTVDFDDLAWSSPTYVYRFTVTAVGRDVRETSAALDRARACLVPVRPVVTGRESGFISERDGDTAVAKDPDANDPATGRPVFFAPTDFEVTTWPA